MPTFTCFDCGGTVNDLAESCPHCGLPKEHFPGRETETETEESPDSSLFEVEGSGLDSPDPNDSLVAAEVGFESFPCPYCTGVILSLDESACPHCGRQMQHFHPADMGSNTRNSPSQARTQEEQDLSPSSPLMWMGFLVLTFCVLALGLNFWSLFDGSKPRSPSGLSTVNGPPKGWVCPADDCRNDAEWHVGISLEPQGIIESFIPACDDHRDFFEFITTSSILAPLLDGRDDNQDREMKVVRITDQ